MMRIHPSSVSVPSPRGHRGTWLAAVTLLLLAAVPLAAQDTIRPDCCALLYSTGRWLGWSAAFLEYTRERDAPTPADALLLQSLSEAGLNAQAANASCLQGLPAWRGWRQKQLWLGHHIAELRKVDRTGIPDPSDKRHRNRRQLAFSAIDTTYEQWAAELSTERWNGDVLHGQTCATFYFQLGFALAAATQAFRQADEAWLAGDEQAAYHQMTQTRLRLGKAHDVLRAYAAMAHRDRPRVACADIGIEALTRMIEMIANRAPIRSRYPEEMRIVSGISDRVGQLLLANCLSGGSGERESRDATGEGAPGSGGTPSTDPGATRLQIPTNMSAWQQVTNWRAPISTTSQGLLLQGGAFTNGRLVNGTYDGNRVQSREVFDLSTGGDIFAAFAVNGAGAYLAFWPRLLTGIAVPRLTTDHAWNNSIVVPHQTWLFGHLRVNRGGGYQFTISTGSYDVKGGAPIYRGSGTLTRPVGRVDFQFMDNYAGAQASLMIGEVWVVHDAGGAHVPGPPRSQRLPAGARCTVSDQCESGICLLGVCAPGSP